MEIKELELTISEVLVDKITIDEFESIIYQDFYVDQIKSNNFIKNVITINYRNKNWKKELEDLIRQSWDTKKYLGYSIRNYCLKLIETDNPDIIFNFVNKIAELNIKYDYEYKTLMQFYLFSNELGLIESGYGSYSVEKLIKYIKTYAKKYINTYSFDIDTDLLLNLEQDFDKTYKKNRKVIEHNTASHKLNKTKTDKKWFQFWKK
ncbi:hypothetical protein [uncultured Aquimarina sp.]|uniref:hypothetical protein n=1 Tax=uncultured Aquimarina sp. TaxID=575652 RepID=UPI002602A334|nr:hypothetical protein [uncultured Aquimarina sp.]